MAGLTIGLFNDSFPPTIDGVANAVTNYARCLSENHGTAVVATPWYPNVSDDYPFEVVRYPSAYISKRLGYRAGYPFDPRVINHLESRNIGLIHTHCPFISTVLGRVLRYQTGAPIVFTYHTKFDIDIEKRVALNPVRSASIKFILSNINACDEVWVVSRGAGENLRGLGFGGEYLVMENGTDFPRGRATEEEISHVRALHGLSPQEPVFLFVGRMMWYKGVRISIDGIKLAREQGFQCKMLFVGEGQDRPDIEAYVAQQGLSDCCIFPGAVRERALLKAYFSAADLFLFPSTYDTSGLVVKEAAACDCPSVLVRGSCAAEGIVDGDTGILIEENPESMAGAIARACQNREWLAAIGKNAGERVYLSWEDAVAKAYSRYGVVLENYEKKQDTPPKNEIFFENVQRVRDDIAQKTKRKVRRILHSYRRQGHRIKATIHHTGKRFKHFLPQTAVKRYAADAVRLAGTLGEPDDPSQSGNFWDPNRQDVP